MRSLFKPKNIIDQDQADWIIEHYIWLAENIGFPGEPLPLIDPTRKFFIVDEEESDARASQIFDQVKELMGLSELQVTLVVQEDAVDPFVSDTMFLQNTPTAPSGTFGLDPDSITEHEDGTMGGELQITYDPALHKNPMGMISTFAHELSHYILLGQGQLARPGGKTHEHETEETLTDLMAIACGFGLFALDQRIRFLVTNQGWQMSGMGYLNEREMTFATALFIKRNGIDSSTAKQYLKAANFKDLQKALKYLEQGFVFPDALAL